MAFDVLKELGNEGEVKAKGKYRQEGKTYVVNDGYCHLQVQRHRQEEVNATSE